MSKVEKVKICCLKGSGSSTSAYKIIPLEGKNEVTMGRNEENTVTILSNMISRKHAILKKSDQGLWTITDNKSLNGITINGKKLLPMVPHTLAEADSVQLGVKVDPEKTADYVWTFHTKLAVKKFKQQIQDTQVSSSQSQSQDDTMCLKERKDNSNNRKRRNDENQLSSSSPSKGSPGKANPCKRSKFSDLPDCWSPSADMRRRLQEQEQKMKEQMEAQEQQLAAMQRLLAEREAAKEKLEEEMLKKEEVMKEELRKQQENLEVQRKQFEEEVKRNFEEQLKDKETSLLSRLAVEKARLLEEKDKVEASLQTEMERKLGEKDKDHEERLQREKEKLDRVIEQKELHQRMLEAQLNETKTENEKHKESMLHAKEDILANFTELIETELQCSICSELFVQATSLNCSHSYCALCIQQWMKVKKECPVCRTPITSHLRSIVLDSYIDRMVEHLSDEMKEKRKELVAERKAEKEKLDEANKPSTSARGGRGGGRGGRRGRRGGANTGHAATNNPTVDAPGGSGVTTRAGRQRVVLPSLSDDDMDVAANEVIDLGSDFSDSDEESERMSYESDDSGSSVEGLDGAYYGGYGTCYRCGNRGHWANGCPFY